MNKVGTVGQPTPLRKGRACDKSENAKLTHKVKERRKKRAVGFMDY